jgi:hypothetical protein
MLVHMVVMGVMQAAVMEVVHMVAVLNGGVAAPRAMGVGMAVMLGLIAGHEVCPFFRGKPRRQPRSIPS